MFPYILLLASWLLQVGINLQRFGRDPLGTLADNAVLFLLLAGTLFAVRRQRPRRQKHIEKNARQPATAQKEHFQ